MNQNILRLSRQKLDDHSPLTNIQRLTSVPPESPPSPPASTETTINCTFDDEPEPWFAFRCRNTYKVMFCGLLLLTTVLIGIVVIVYYHLHVLPVSQMRLKHTTRSPIPTSSITAWETYATKTMTNYMSSKSIAVSPNPVQNEKPVPRDNEDRWPEPVQGSGAPHERGRQETIPGITPPQLQSTRVQLINEFKESLATVTVKEIGDQNKSESANETDDGTAACETSSMTTPTLQTTLQNTVISLPSVVSLWSKRLQDKSLTAHGADSDLHNSSTKDAHIQSSIANQTIEIKTFTDETDFGNSTIPLNFAGNYTSLPPIYSGVFNIHAEDNCTFTNCTDTSNKTSSYNKSEKHDITATKNTKLMTP